MNRQTKKEIRRLAVKILVAVLALGLAFWGYAFVYRGKTEPPAKYPVTNQDAAVYSWTDTDAVAAGGVKYLCL